MLFLEGPQKNIWCKLFYGKIILQAGLLIFKMPFRVDGCFGAFYGEMWKDFLSSLISEILLECWHIPPTMEKETSFKVKANINFNFPLASSFRYCGGKLFGWIELEGKIWKIKSGWTFFDGFLANGSEMAIRPPLQKSTKLTESCFMLASCYCLPSDDSRGHLANFKR
jgi:hypothetical protein